MPATASKQRPVVVITGAAGNIGSAIAQVLTRDYEVVGLDMPKLADNAPVPCLGIDLTDDDSVTAALDQLRERHGAKLASVLHLAAYFDFTGEENPLYEEVNVEGTRRLLSGLREGFEVAQFIYSGTMLVHEPGAPGVPITEDAPIAPKWAYPQSKAHAEEVIRQCAGDIPWVLLHLAGLYTDRGGVPTLVHQIQRIYERDFHSQVFAGDPTHGQSYVHMDDVVDAFSSCVERRTQLPADTTILIGEPEAVSYEAMQNIIGRLIHGESWETLRVPKPVARAGAWAEQKMEPVVPDAIDKGEKPFIRPFMVPMADDHYELDISRARKLLDWHPRHNIRDVLPRMIEALKDDPAGWYEENGLVTPDWMDEAEEEAIDPEDLRQRYETVYRSEHRRFLWAHWINMGLGSWLLTSPAIMGVQELPMRISDWASGAAVMLFAAISLSWRAPWARWATAAVGTWVMFAPLWFWSTSAAAYTNDTLVGALIIGFAVCSRPAAGVAMVAKMMGPDVPKGWDYSPSTWFQRMPIILLAFVGLYVSRYLAGYQLEQVDGVWEPFFAGGPDPKNGTEEIITSDVSKAWPVPDAGLGALTYMLEILTGLIGSRRRWRTMPWLVMAFGIMIVPLGAISIFFIIIQPIVIGTWCTLCLIAAAAMLLQIPYSFDELFATSQFLYRRWKAGRPLLRVFFFGDTDEGGRRCGPDDFSMPPGAMVKDMFGGGVNVPWNLALTILIGVWLMLTRLTLGTEGAMANADHLIGALLITISVTAFAEVARPLRFANALLGAALVGTPFLFDGGSTIASALSIALGLALIALSLPRGRVKGHYDGWDRYIV